jgi:hypothetical protein
VEVVRFVKEAVFEEDGLVVDDWHGEPYIFGPINGSVTKELDNTTAIFYYMRERTHFCYKYLVSFLYREMMVGNGGNG